MSECVSRALRSSHVNLESLKKTHTNKLINGTKSSAHFYNAIMVSTHFGSEYCISTQPDKTEITAPLASLHRCIGNSIPLPTWMNNNSNARRPPSAHSKRLKMCSCAWARHAHWNWNLGVQRSAVSLGPLEKCTQTLRTLTRVTDWLTDAFASDRIASNGKKKQQNATKTVWEIIYQCREHATQEVIRIMQRETSTTTRGHCEWAMCERGGNARTNQTQKMKRKKHRK